MQRLPSPCPLGTTLTTATVVPWEFRGCAAEAVASSGPPPAAARSESPWLLNPPLDLTPSSRAPHEGP